MENPLENLDEETQAKIQELQILEQNFQQLMMQKQAFQQELHETDFALKELEKSEGEVFKMVGSQVIIKTTKEDLTKDMKEKKDLIELRMKNIDAQEKEFSEKVNTIRDEVMKKISGKPKNTDDKKDKK